MYFDAHNHLQDEWLTPHLPRVLETLEKIGIAGAVVNGTIDTDWESVARLGRERPWVIPSYGVHPWRIKERGCLSTCRRPEIAAALPLRSP